MKKFLKHIAYGFFFFVLINLLIVLKYEYPAYKAIKEKTHKNYLKWNNIYENKNTYDLIILGSSRSYTGFNPKVIDSVLKLKSFNMGTSAQDIAESYHSLVEILNHQNPKYIVLETYLDLSDDRHDYYQIFSNASFFKSSSNKFELISNGYGSNGIANYFIPLMKFNNYIKQDIITLFSKAAQKAPETDWYKGYLKDTVIITKKKIAALSPVPNFDNTPFNKERFNTYFNKIKELTKSKGIKLIVLRTPYPPTRLKLDDNADEENFYKSYFKNITDVKFYDLNHYKAEIFKYSDEDFSDHHHANLTGAKKISLQLSDIIKTNQTN
ncbi:hypothetical protein [Winogradskyella sp.]|jgi:hypothetical protein|uniref:hypothetical protein n=1 Tax=Winogradskyella sp. TaxID=1883156 RepID=UPI0025DD9F9F|nr:hypothetical protein [Winogradskyella sp.]MCT4629155.1 hypothetical protein [Winogradskyella sp.]